MEKGTVDGKANKFGPAIKIGGDWKTLGDSVKGMYDQLNKGDQIEYTLQGKYVRELKVVGAAPAPAPGSQAKSGGRQDSPEVRAEIARSTAVKAVLGSLALGALLDKASIGETTSTLEQYTVRVTRFILTGSFDEVK